MKINISIDDDLLVRLDSVADSNYMSRSGLISYAVVQYLNQQEVVKAITDVSLAMRKIADNNELDAESRQQLEDFERIIKMAVGK